MEEQYMAKRIMLLVLAFSVATAIIFAGCTPARKPMYTGEQSNRTGMYGNTNNQYDPALTNNWGTRGLNNSLDKNNNKIGLGKNNRLGNDNGMGNNINFNATTQRTGDIELICKQVQGVKDATVVISGNTAYVGLVLDKSANITNDTDIKNNVAQKIRLSNTGINTVYVSTETNFMQRLRNVGNGINGGRPIEGFTTELKDMIRRITPTNW